MTSQNRQKAFTTYRNLGLGVQEIELTLEKLFPIFIDYRKYLDYTLKQVNIKYQKRLEKLVGMIKNLNQKAFYSLFWIIFYTIFQENKNESVKLALKERFVINYGKFFFSITTEDKN